MGHVETPCRLYLGTEDGLWTVTVRETGAERLDSALAGEAVRALAVSPADPDDVLVGCGLRGHGLYRTRDGGRTVESLGFDSEWVWGVSRHPNDPETVYVGTEPPMLYRSTDGGASFSALDGIEAVPSREDWTFFHEPFQAGHIHGIAVHPDRPEQVFAGVEHGGILCSRDGGETWQDSVAAEDIHRVAVHPEDPDRVFVAAGSGLYRSDDAGRSWEQVPDLAGEYAHSIVFDPRSPERMYAYAATEEMPVYRSDDGGDSWVGIGAGLPEARAADTLCLHPANPDVVLYAGDTDDGGRLFLSPDGGESWDCLDLALPTVWRLTVADAGS
jgi:photosystem II stability/assembly factor-like uncharacterized protein